MALAESSLERVGSINRGFSILITRINKVSLLIPVCIFDQPQISLFVEKRELYELEAMDMAEERTPCKITLWGSARHYL